MREIGALRYAFSLSPIFNRSGSFSMTMPLDDKIAYSVAKHSTCVVCQRNDEIRWSGPIVSVIRDPAAMTLSLTALGWLDELFHRFAPAGRLPGSGRRHVRIRRRAVQPGQRDPE
jgi:hypothetical protein